MTFEAPTHVSSLKPGSIGKQRMSSLPAATSSCSIGISKRCVRSTSADAEKTFFAGGYLDSSPCGIPSSTHFAKLEICSSESERSSLNECCTLQSSSLNAPH